MPNRRQMIADAKVVTRCDRQVRVYTVVHRWSIRRYVNRLMVVDHVSQSPITPTVLGFTTAKQSEGI